jgi:prophage antirepressor-like protein
MTNLTLFSFDSQPVRSFVDDEPWFIARDVFEALGITWKKTQSLNHIPSEWKKIVKLNLSKDVSKEGYLLGTRTINVSKEGTEIPFRTRIVESDTWVINEPAVYKTAFRSDKPNADRFTNWVVKEVLPSIRKTGSYTITSDSEYADIVSRATVLDKFQQRELANQLKINTIEIVPANERETEKKVSAKKFLASYLYRNRHRWLTGEQILEACNHAYTIEELTYATQKLTIKDRLSVTVIDKVLYVQYREGK